MANRKFKVLHRFIDLEGKERLYEEGDIFPKPANKKLTEKRIKELTTSKNKRGKALIEEIKEEQ
ncbi:hypothetical protein NGH74_13930 [Staphylococcus pseudoxylosus]|uniref:hypothetical protein n=1 Tax=Staphylococcus TaxID=1279 RepID=UPI00057BEAEF|nr:MULTISPECIES: hypothetical protein [Staphylococcus]MEB8088260.1 hypothetical protein [Staphylococcus pseudoxylosus]